MTYNTPQVTIIIVTFNSRQTVSTALDETYKAHTLGLARIIVVDNDSNDETVKYIKSNYQWVTLIENENNSGFGAGCNLGLEQATTPYILLLNPDAVLDTDNLAILISFMDDHEQVGLCAPAVVEDSGKLQPSGGQLTPWKALIKPLIPGVALKGMRHPEPGEQPMETDWICGSIFFIRKKVIDEIGSFDPRFFLYFEESDLCYRAKKAGWGIWTVGKSVGGHINAASAKSTKAQMIWGTIAEHYFKSRFYFFSKHYGFLLASFAEIGELFFMFLRAARELIRKKPYENLKIRLRSPFFSKPTRPGPVKPKE